VRLNGEEAAERHERCGWETAGWKCCGGVEGYHQDGDFVNAYGPGYMHSHEVASSVVWSLWYSIGDQSTVTGLSHVRG
jgi:hypothetical protein